MRLQPRSADRSARHAHARGFAVVLALASVLTGCAGPGAALRQGSADARSIRVTQEGFRGTAGERIAVTRFAPRRVRTPVPVVLAPGFMRSRAHLEGLARTLAGLGIEVLTLDPVNARPWGGRPVQDALDMIAAARRTGTRAAVYGGFSAGGLAALIAGRLDPGTRGVLGLDLVDDRGLGARLAPGLDRPLIGLAGEPAGCNAYGNGVWVIAAAPQGRLTRIPGASHCDFEAPTDRLCETLCTGTDAGAAARRAAIVAAAAAALSDLLGLKTQVRK